MKKKDDLLDDLEDFVNCDWKEVHDNFQKEEYQKEISEPVIPDFPVYREFYDLMVDIVDDPQVSPRIGYLIERFVRNRSRKINKGFERVWEFFTDPRQYQTHEETCGGCRTRYNVISKRQNTYLPRPNIDSWNNQTVEMRSEYVSCPTCGRPFMHLAGEVVGVFK